MVPVETGEGRFFLNLPETHLDTQQYRAEQRCVGGGVNSSSYKMGRTEDGNTPTCNSPHHPISA